MKTFFGNTFLIISCLVTINLWILSKNSFSLQNTALLVSQILALLGFVLLTDSLILSTRSRFLEKIFGGLDKLYRVHKYIGSLSFVFILNHPMLLLINALPDFKLASIYTVPGYDLYYNLGVFALYLMLLSFIFMVFIKLPYQLWKVSHQLLGFSFLLSGIHMLFISSDVSAFLPLKFWMIANFVAGTVSFIYITFLYEFFGPKYEYEVTNISRSLDVINIYLKPIKRKLNFTPGQFVYLSIEGKNPGREIHPFSISSGPDDPILRISAKVLGDYTLKLSRVIVGSKVHIFGPYGSFGQKFIEEPAKDAVWIAGGIGITPFLSLLKYFQINPGIRNVDFYYCYSGSEEAIFDGEVREMCNKSSEIKYLPWDTSQKSHLTADLINQSILELKDRIIQICGPEKMMSDLGEQFIKEGVPLENIVFENFNLL